MADENKKDTKKAVRVEPVYGDMVHVVLDKPIRGITPFDEIDPWLQAQLDAGKLKKVD